MDLAKSLAFSAVGGLVVGMVGCGGDGKKADEPSADSSAAPAADSAAAVDASGAKACCAGLNECSKKGGCKTADHGCAGQNECSKKGGCKKRPDMPECAQ